MIRQFVNQKIAILSFAMVLLVCGIAGIGIYFYQLQADNTSTLRKMVILK